MSGEFRWIDPSYMHDALEQAARGDRGEHGVSQALQDIYRALAPLELAAARCEACDADFAEPAMALIEAGPALDAAFVQIMALRRKYAALAESVLTKARAA